MSEAVVKFVNINKKYHDLTAVGNMNLEIHRGEILGFVGPNGAGKTTTMKMLGGLVKPTMGNIEISVGNGSFINIRKAPTELFKRFGFLIDIPAFYGHVTPKKILKYYCRLLGVPRKEIEKQIDWVLEIVELSQWKNKVIKEFSKGMKQRLGLAQSLVHDPEVLVLDEPQTGLDPAARVQVRKIMKRVKDMGKTIFLSSHMLYEITEICDRMAIINHGELIAVDKLVNLEQRMTKKEIAVELLNPMSSSQLTEITENISQKIEPFGPEGEKSSVIYDNELPGFRIYYDGKPSSRKEIHDILSLEMKLPIIGYSRVKTSRLEDLYMDLIGNDNGEKKQKHDKNNKRRGNK